MLDSFVTLDTVRPLVSRRLLSSPPTQVLMCSRISSRPPRCQLPWITDHPSRVSPGHPPQLSPLSVWATGTSGSTCPKPDPWAPCPPTQIHVPPVPPPGSQTEVCVAIDWLLPASDLAGGPGVEPAWSGRGGTGGARRAS